MTPMTTFRFFTGFVLFFLFTVNPALGAQEEELLPPDKAFSLSAYMDGNTLVAEFKIAPGYYMYRERFEFLIESSDAAARFDTAIIPKGKIKEDEFFGRTETYRDRVSIRLPVLYETATASRLKVKVVSQGCADIGVCYPPQKQALKVDVASTAPILPTAWEPPADKNIDQNSDVAALQALLGQVTDNLETNSQSTAQSKQESSNPLSALQALGDDIGLDQEDDIPHPNEAFILTAKLDAANIIQTNILLADNIYVYRDKIQIAMIEGEGHKIGAISLPRGEIIYDEFFGESEVIYDQVDVSIPIISESGASGQFRLSYSYQGCVKDRICYPPITKFLVVDAAQGLIEVQGEFDDIASDSTRSPTGGDTSAPVSEQGRFAQLLRSGSLLLIVGLFFLAGIGLTFTPCVFPMIPILSSIIAGQGESITTRKAFTLSGIYVLTMAITYAALGAIVGYYGARFNIQIWFQDPVILSGFAAVFVLLALSMFGFYELQMPNAIQSRLTAMSNSQEGGKVIGVGLMGFFSAIIVGPCITAPLVGALIFISQTQDWQLGALALFSLGLGMGVPLMIVGTSAGKLLPRAGGWMDTVKAVFGVVMLGVAIYLLERILPVGITMMLIAALLIGSSIYLGALDSLSEVASGWRRFSKSMGLLVLIYGATYLFGAASGSRDLIQPLRGLGSSMTGVGGEIIATEALPFRPIKGRQELDVALQNAMGQERGTMLYFYADWCISCKEMEKYTYSDPKVRQTLSSLSLLKADVTPNDEKDIDLMTSIGIYGPPAILFFDASGKEIQGRRVVGFMPAAEFSAHVRNTYRQQYVQMNKP